MAYLSSLTYQNEPSYNWNNSRYATQLLNLCLVKYVKPHLLRSFICICLFLTGNGLGIRVVGGKEVPRSNGEIGAYVAKVLPGGAAEQTGKILEGNLFFSFSIVNFGLAKTNCLGNCPNLIQLVQVEQLPGGRGATRIVFQ